MATLNEMAFDYAMQRGTGKKAHVNFMAGAKAVIRKIQEADSEGGIDAVVHCVNTFIEELSNQ